MKGKQTANTLERHSKWLQLETVQTTGFYWSTKSVLKHLSFVKGKKVLKFFLSLDGVVFDFMSFHTLFPERLKSPLYDCFGHKLPTDPAEGVDKIIPYDVRMHKCSLYEMWNKNFMFTV